MTRPGLTDLGDVAIGAAVRAGESTAGAVARLRSLRLHPVQRPATALEELRQRGGSALDDLRQRGETAVDGLRVRGGAERGRARAGAERALDAAMTAIATSPLVDRIVAVQVDRVLALLEREPERIRALVVGQRDTMVGEAVGRVRAGAAAGDAAVDRLTLRMTRRDGRA